MYFPVEYTPTSANEVNKTKTYKFPLNKIAVKVIKSAICGCCKSEIVSNIASYSTILCFCWQVDLIFLMKHYLINMVLGIYDAKLDNTQCKWLVTNL